MKLNVSSLFLAALSLLFIPDGFPPAGDNKLEARLDSIRSGDSARPVIRKLGTVDCDLVETTPIVFRGKLYRFEWVRKSYRKNALQKDHFRLVEHDSGRATRPFAEGYVFGSAYVEEGTIYAEAVYDGTEVDFLRAWFPDPKSAQNRNPSTRDNLEFKKLK